MKKIAFAILGLTSCLCSVNEVKAQSKGIFTYGVGWSLLSDVAISPFYYEKSFDPNQTFSSNNLNQFKYNTKDIYRRSSSFSLISYSFHLNTKLVALTNDKSISVNAAPTLRFSFSEMGLFGFSLPVTLNYNSGVLSTFDTEKEKGFMIGLGALIQTTPLISGSMIRSSAYSYGTHVYIQPCLQLAYRKWGSDTKVHEFSLQVGYSNNKDFATYDVVTDSNTGQTSYVQSGSLKNTAISAKLTFIKYLNY